MKTTKILLASAVCAAMLFAGCSEKGGDVYTITVVSGENGQATTDKTTAAEGAAITLTAIPDPGYNFMAWSCDGVIFHPKATATKVAFEMPAKNVIVTSEFAAVEYAVTVTSGDNGEASADKTTSTEGATIKLTATADPGCEFVKWTVESGGITLLPNATTSPATFTMPTGDVEIKAEFAAIEYTVTVTSGGNGTAETDKESAAEGAIVTLTATPVPGYLFVKWTVDNGDVEFSSTAANPATFTMPAGNVEISAEFVAKTYAVTVTSGDNGTAEADMESAAEGATVTLTATPDDGYEFVKWTVESGDVTLSSTTTNPATFTMPAGDVEITAKFIEGLRINGVVWAYTNVDVPGTFAVNPEDYGMFYQWNRKVGWSSEDPLTSSPAGATWDNTYIAGESWAAENDPCPVGWRVPTHEEQVALCDDVKTDSEWEPVNGVNGRMFTDKVSGNSVFFPAAGVRDHSSGGALSNAGQLGYYWSATPYSTLAYLFSFDLAAVIPSYYSRTIGFSVRCVAE